MKKHNRILIYCFLIIGALFGLFSISEWLWPELWGSHSLGNDLYLINWENDTKIVVFSKNLRGNTCYSGSFVIPSGPVSTTREYVVDAVSNDNYIIILSLLIDNNKNKYYVISKDFGDLNDPVLEITERHLHPFEDYTSFCNTCDSLGISIPSSWK